ncbi:helix-turn-helix domain-containing protein [Streptomyces sp. NPDC051546]|uniref:helix-turn-helix domain-containing protein n=1 Tax=Streptomyces sp. NPDC051546 TaxID=3365655 RepID=UPI0037955131
MDTPDIPGEQDLARVVAALTKQFGALDRTPERMMDFDHIESTTGIPAATVRRLFTGEPVAPDDLNRSFKQRLEFLRRTRPREDGKPYSAEQLAQVVGIAKPTMSAQIRGDRKPTLEVNNKLEEFFGVAPGFFTMSGEEALVNALARVSDQVLVLSQAKGIHVEHLALRGSIAAGNDELAQELRAALFGGLASPSRSAEQHPEEHELRELTDTMRALPAGRRRSVMNVVRGVLGLAHDDESAGPDHHHKK